MLYILFFIFSTMNKPQNIYFIIFLSGTFKCKMSNVSKLHTTCMIIRLCYDFTRFPTIFYITYYADIHEA